MLEKSSRIGSRALLQGAGDRIFQFVSSDTISRNPYSLTGDAEEPLFVGHAVPGDCRRQAQAGERFAAADFAIDWQAQQTSCPEGGRYELYSQTTAKRENASG